MLKNLRTSAVECLENGNYHVYRKLFLLQNNILDPSARKLQESGNKENKIKEN